MKLKWQWFLGGQNMFWISIVVFVVFVFIFFVTYIIDPVSLLNMRVQKVDETSIKNISEKYVKNLGIEVDKPIVYRFVRYNWDKGFKSDSDSNILLGTFHEWNGKYYIDISVDLYKLYTLEEIVIHETRHMLVEYLKDKKVIDLSKYSEEIALNNNSGWNKLFDDAIYFLKKSQ